MESLSFAQCYLESLKICNNNNKKKKKKNVNGNNLLVRLIYKLRAVGKMMLGSLVPQIWDDSRLVVEIERKENI